MADKELIGEWHIGKPFEMPPQWLVDFKDSVNTIAEWLVASLEIINAMLDVIKTFLVGINDPISALIKALMKEITKILRDIQQIGLYFTSDRKLVTSPPKDLLGGYTAAEKRMVGRLTDRLDIGRPNVSPNTLMLGFFFYASADTSAYYELIATMNKLLGLFSFSMGGGKFSPVANLVASYSSSDPQYRPTYGKNMFSSPKEITVSWSQQVSGDLAGVDISAILLPFNKADNFLIEVSTEPMGLPVFVTTQDFNKASPGGKSGDGKPQQKTYMVMTREDGDLSPLTLYGGADRITTDLFNYEDVTDSSGALETGAHFVHTILPSVNPAQPIPFHLLKDESDPNNPTYFLQRSFLLGKNDGNFFTTNAVSQNNRIKIPVDQLPKGIKISGTGKDLLIEEDTDNPPTTYYFRVTPIGKFDPSTQPFARYSILFADINSENMVARNPIEIGKASAPYRLVVPRDTTAQYQESVESALLCLLLSRPDLDTDAISTPFLDEDKQKIYGIFGIEPRKFFSKDIPIKDFRKRVRDLVRSKTYEIMNGGGLLTETVEKFVVENSKELREFTWNMNMENSNLPQITLRQSFGLDLSDTQFMETDFGVAPNSQSLVLGKLEQEPKIRRMIETNDSNATAIIQQTSATERVKKSVYDKRVAQLTFYSESLNNPFTKSQEREREWLTESVLKDQKGEIIVFRENNVEYVRLFPKSKRYATNKQVGANSLINGNSPLVYNDLPSIISASDTEDTLSGRIFFTRNVLLDYNGGDLLKQSAFVLNIATASIDKKSESEWDYVRLGDMGVFYYIEKTLNTILNTVSAIMEGLQGVIDSILKFIDFLQQRINEVQNVIRRINALIQSIGLFEIPSVNLLLLASKGTDGVLQDIISAPNKPSDPSSSLGFGAMALVPIPLANVIIDLFYPDTDIDGLLSGTQGEQ